MECTQMSEQQARVIERNVGFPGRRPAMRLFYECDDGTRWAVKPEHEYQARRWLGARVTIRVTCPDDQFATLIGCT